MKARWAVAAALAISLLGTVPGAAQHGPERAALARQLADILSPPSEDARVAAAAAEAMSGLARMTMALSGGAPPLDERQLELSFNAGARANVSASRASFVRALAEGMRAEDLQETLDFYRSRSGRAALRALAAHAARLERWLRSAVEARDRGEPSRSAPEYTPGAAERDFAASRAGQALASIASMAPSAKDSLQQAVAFAEADYCAHAVCGADQHDFFLRITAIINRRRARGEHGMWGRTAGDLFPDPVVASLARAACVGDAEAVAQAVQAGADPNAVGGEGSGPGGVSQMVTPLLWAIDCGNVAGIEALLRARADPNQREQFGATPVTVAADNKDPAILQALLRSGGDPNAHDGRQTALEIALEAAGWLESVDQLPNERAWANWNALLTAGADPDRVAPEGRPLMETAAGEDQWDKVEWLIQRGWDGDLVLLGRQLESREGAGVPEARLPALRRVKAFLEARGVCFPVGGLGDLERDSRGFYVQPQAPASKSAAAVSPRSEALPPYNEVLIEQVVGAAGTCLRLRHDGALGAGLFFQDDKRVLTWGYDGSARIWNAVTGAAGPTFQHQEGIYDTVLTRDESRAVTVSSDNTARLWNTATGRPIGPPLEHASWVRGAAFSPDETRLATWGVHDGAVKIWDAATGAQQAGGAVLRHERGVWGARFSRDGTRILTWGDSARVWDSRTGSAVSPFMAKDVPGGLVGALFFADERRILGWGAGGARVWDATTGVLIRAFDNGPVDGGLLAAEETRLFTWGPDYNVRLWDVATGRQIAEFEGHRSNIMSVQLSADERRILTSSADDTARVWNAANGAQLAPALRHDDQARGAVFSSDETGILTWSRDGTARLWDSATGQQIGPAMVHSRPVDHALFSHDGSRVLTTSAHGGARIWSIAELARLAQSASADEVDWRCDADDQVPRRLVRRPAT